MQNSERCELIGRVFAYLEQYPKEGAERLREFLTAGDRLLSTDDVMVLTGWSRTYVIRLCKQGILPHIPGNPHKFLRGPLMQALHQMQRGGPYGRRKTRAKAKTK